jgi:hypothetical protein
MTGNQFNRWVDTQLRECKRVTGLEPLHISTSVMYDLQKTRRSKGLDAELNEMCKLPIDSLFESVTPFTFSYMNEEDNGKFAVVVFNSGNNLRLINIETGKSGLARKHPNDELNYHIGLAVAWANYCGIEIPELDEDMPVYKVTPCVNPKCFKPGTIILDRKLDLKYIYVSDYDKDSMIVKYCDNPKAQTVIPKTDKDYKIVGKIKLEV